MYNEIQFHARVNELACKYDGRAVQTILQNKHHLSFWDIQELSDEELYEELAKRELEMEDRKLNPDDYRLIKKNGIYKAVHK